MGVVVVNEDREGPLKVLLMEDEQPVETFGARRADEPARRAAQRGRGGPPALEGVSMT